MSNATEKIKEGLAAQQYIASDEIATVVYLAEQLGKPILSEGPAGVGKTELSKAWAGAMGRRLIRLQCYEGLDESMPNRCSIPSSCGISCRTSPAVPPL
jgi:MoxR-like ATPase